MCTCVLDIRARIAYGPVVGDEERLLGQTMQAVVCHGPRDYRLEEVDVPEPGPGEALVRVEAVGMCAGDLKCYDGAPKFWGVATRRAWGETEVVPGHELGGVVGG